MLKVLELTGFKSFADRTRFVFPPAITVVVGPNGSGKSNIVDSIKWVLGTQSVKSLRGKEMTDVIFNGSGTRPPVNTAEVTLTFDNSNRRLAVDTPEVAITRRVYRSGEGEYLINRQPCRLRDIRDLFSGTGVATDAYSVIEQGKVDLLLQASARDRRAIFEEAAGISRFKAKKLEAERRLDRVDQNLLRLSDIVDEVESRLRSVRAQAGKARRYRDYTQRLQSLRTQVGLTDWRALSDAVEHLDEQIAQLDSARNQLGAELERIEAETLSFEAQIAKQDVEIDTGEARVARNRESIAAGEATIEYERARCHDVEEELTRQRRQLVEMGTRAGDVQQQLNATQAAWEAAGRERARLKARLQQDQQVVARLAQRLEQTEQGASQCRGRQVEQMRAAAALGNVISGATLREAAAADTRRRSEEQRAEIQRARVELADQLAACDEREKAAAETLRQCEADVDAQESARAQTRDQLSQGQRQLADIQGRYAAASERAAVLAELERRLEGLGAGVKDVLTRARQAEGGPFRQIRGLLADLLRVNVETAPLVDAALGQLAQYLVLAPDREVLDALTRESRGFRGPVGFLLTDDDWPDEAAEDPGGLNGQPGIIGRADQFVETAPEYGRLVRRLLGRTYFVETLADALALNRTRRPGVVLVTRQAERVAADGSLLVGPRHAATGLISRRSELRALDEQRGELRDQVAAAEASVRELEADLTGQDLRLRQLGQQRAQQTRQLGECGLATASVKQRLEQLDGQRDVLAEQAAAAAVQQESAVAQLQEAQQRLNSIEAELATLETQIETDTEQIDLLRNEHAQHQQRVTVCRVELAKAEQQHDSLHNQLAQFQRDREERCQALAEIRNALETHRRRAQEAQRNILRSETEVAELYLQEEQIAAEVRTCRMQREVVTVQRNDAIAAAQKIRREVHAIEEQLHAKQLEADRVRHQREALAERIREDYGIELATLTSAPDPDAQRQREEVEQEIAALRKKLNNIGSVNLEALHELEELEERFNSLSAQYSDLNQAKATLEQIIARINTDSRRLFAATVDEVRTHFQFLFRRLFGGGQADIMLEEGENVDILESGIEIVARPPGKEPRNISLLSGGEKTLTCVALLLAIFRSRPSPFCVLDEVDAALDEANIARFTNVLTEFLSSTQFVVITHSKKTMTAGNTLYGITMQESGVSKRVAVQFEDVRDNGEIRESAVAADQAEEAADRETSPPKDGTQAA